MILSEYVLNFTTSCFNVTCRMTIPFVSILKKISFVNFKVQGISPSESQNYLEPIFIYI